jgi:hypothetical protein
MPDASVRFLVTCPARTGSTLLVGLLASHPDICAHGEVLAPKGPLNFYGVNYRQEPPLEGILMAIRDRDPVAFLHDFVWQPGARSAAGFKGKYEELLLPSYQRVLDAIVADTSVRVLHLTRENLLARFLSQHLAVKVHRRFNVSEERDRPPEVRVRLSPRECEDDFRRTEDRQILFRAWLRRHQVLEVTYEELVGRPETLPNILSFLGVEHHDLEAPSKKLNVRPIWETIENYEELASYFRRTEYARFFER